MFLNYNPKTNRIDKFKPDFIFWLKKWDEYLILFVDPNGTEHTDGYRKIDGYIRTLGDKVSLFLNGLNIKTKLLFKAQYAANVEDKYRIYWFDISSFILSLIVRLVNSESNLVFYLTGVLKQEFKV